MKERRWRRAVVRIQLQTNLIMSGYVWVTILVGGAFSTCSTLEVLHRFRVFQTLPQANTKPLNY